jgi:hypothetical protein
MKHSFIRALLAMVALFDLEFKQIDVKQCFYMENWKKLSICINQRGSLRRLCLSVEEII